MCVYLSEIRRMRATHSVSLYLALRIARHCDAAEQVDGKGKCSVVGGSEMYRTPHTFDQVVRYDAPVTSVERVIRIAQQE